MSPSEKRRAANAQLEQRASKGLGTRVAGIEAQVADHEDRIGRVESEAPPPAPPRPTPPSVRLHTPALPFRPAYRSDPDLRREAEEARHLQATETEAQKRYAKLREDVDRELEQKLQDVSDDVSDLKTGVAVLARAHGLEALLPASFRGSIPPTEAGRPRKPELPGLRREVRVAGFLALALVVRDVVHDLHELVAPLLKHLGAP